MKAIGYLLSWSGLLAVGMTLSHFMGNWAYVFAWGALTFIVGMTILVDQS